MIEWQPALEQHGGGIVGNAGPPSRSNLPVVPRDGVAGSGIAGGAAASNQVHPPGNIVAAIPPPPEDIYFGHYTFKQVRQFQPSPYGVTGLIYTAPDGLVFICIACFTSKAGTSARDRQMDFCPRSAPFRTFVEKLKKEGKYIPLVDEHSVQASGTFSTVAGNGDDDDSDDVMPPPKWLGKKRSIGPTLDDSDDYDDGKPAAKSSAKKRRALCSSDTASERPLESGPPVPEGPVPTVAAMPLEAARAAAPREVALLVLERRVHPGKVQRRCSQSQEDPGRVMKRSHTSPWRKAIKKVV